MKQWQNWGYQMRDGQNDAQVMSKISTHIRVTQVYNLEESMLHFRGMNIRKELPYADKSKTYFIEVKVPASKCNTLPVIGQVWKITGSPSRDSVVEKGWKKERYTFKNPNYSEMTLSLIGNEIKYFIGKNKAFKGIGQVTSTELFNEFPDLFDMLNSNELGKVECHPKFSKHVPSLKEGWKIYENLKYASFFIEHEIPHSVQQALFGHLSNDTVQGIKQNPYILQTFGMAFDKVDSIARKKFNVSINDPRRLIALVENAMSHFIKQGHTYATYDQIFTQLGHNQEALVALQESQSNWGIIYDEVTDTVHSVPLYIMESTVAKRILHLANTVIEPSEDIDDQVAIAKAKLGFSLEEKQSQAVMKAANNAFSVICGGAGTGKTTVLRVIVEAYVGLGFQVFPMALSGRASMKLFESIDHPTLTIAKFLLHAREYIDLEKQQLIIVDEASMVDIAMMYDIVTKVPSDAQILLVGDDGQIAPIDAGLVLSEVIEALPYYTTRLDVVKRQDEVTGIPEYSSAIRAKKVPKLLTYKAITFKETSPRIIPKVCVQYMSDGVQVICATKRMADAINLAVQSAVNSNPFIQWGGSETYFKVNDPIIFTKNDQELGVQNGTIGKIIKYDADNETIYVDKGGDGEDSNIVCCDHFYDMDLAYAITLHKAQGSQYHTAVVIVEDNAWLVDNSWIYTAVTRATDKLVILGREKTMVEAISRPSSSEKRQTYLTSLIEVLCEQERDST
ncbi:AAA family ATPase [Vibrio sp. 10N.261.51.A3]|uniref:AAA family ATPase n=1 Tax=Vibrio sp. 10N.261.51.A3 TaxID=3229673 RepID=UPI00354C5A34